MALKWPDKDPNEVLDYQLRWTKRVPSGDEIAASDWIVPTGITKQSDTFTATATTIWLARSVVQTGCGTLCPADVGAGKRTRNLHAPGAELLPSLGLLVRGSS
jgi:hypothetical protein